MDEEIRDLPPESRNGQSTCNGEDLAKLIAARLENKNVESQSQTDEASIAKSSLEPVTTSSPVHGSGKESPPTTSHDVGRMTSYDEGDVDDRNNKHYEKRAAVQSMCAADESKFIIRDTITGIAYDIRSQDTATMLNEVDQMLTKLPGQKAKKPWEEWWREKRENNYELMNVAERGEKEKVLELLDEVKHGDLIADINAKGLDDFTPLHFCASEGHAQVAALLLTRGAQVDSLTTSLRTPLHVACNRGNKEIVELLVNSGANLNAQDRDGNTPTHILANGAWADALNWLLTKQPSLSIKNAYGETAIEMAANVEIRQVFALHSKGSGKSDTYSRTVMEGVILHDNRADMVKSFMFRAQLMEGQRDKPTPPKPVVPVLTTEPANHDPSKVSTRRIKILEWTKKLNAAPSASVEEKKSGMKNSSSSDKQEKDEAAGPEDFEILSMLGSGSFGEVYLVKYKRTGQLYAMKVLNKKKVMSQNLVKYARTERNVLCYTKHPFIVGLNFAFQTSEKLFMIMDYCPGGDLGNMVKREKRLAEDKAKLYAAEIILALEDLHKRDIIFRDLKPDNVVLDEEGHALLTDFGLSKEGVGDNISAKSFCGSIAYLAPEMLRRSGHGKSVDWYLLGVLLYELVVGKPPYFTCNKEQLFKNIQTAPLKLPMFLSADVKNLLIALLNRNPLKRLGSGRNDADEIKAHPWFKSINWDEVINKKVKPPKPVLKAHSTAKVTANVFADNVKEDNRLTGWDFKSKHNNI